MLASVRGGSVRMSNIEGLGRYLEPWKDATFGGRARRPEYWPFALGNLVLVFLAVSSLADPVPPEQENLAQTALIAICGLARWRHLSRPRSADARFRS
jgi:hypothetical protein